MLPKAMRPPAGVKERRPAGLGPTMHLPDEQRISGGGGELNEKESITDEDDKGANSWAGTTV